MFFPEMVAPTAYPQNAVTGGLTGTVADNKGAVLPNAMVTIKDTQTGETRTATTNAVRGLVAALFDLLGHGQRTRSGIERFFSLSAFGSDDNCGHHSESTSTSETVTVSVETPQLIDTQTPKRRLPIGSYGRGSF